MQRMNCHKPRSAPRPPAAGVAARQPFADQSVADARPVDPDDPQLAAEAVLIAVDRLEADRAAIEQLAKPAGRLVAERLFLGAARLVGFGRVDVGNADFLPA